MSIHGSADGILQQAAKPGGGSNSFYRDTEEAVDTLERHWGTVRLQIHLRQMLTSSDERLHERALYALKYAGPALGNTIPELLEALCTARDDRRGRVLETLDRIDPQWTQHTAACSVVPILCNWLADLRWVDLYWSRRGPWPSTATMTGDKITGRLLGYRSNVDADPLEYRGQQLLSRTLHGQWALRIIRALDEIESGWRSTDCGRRAIADLKLVWQPEHIDFQHAGRYHAADALLRCIDVCWNNERKSLKQLPLLPIHTD